MSDSIRVLYVDDDAGLGRLLEKSLVARGMTVIHVETSDEALRLLSEGTFDAIALDHMLASETGLDIIAKIQKSSDPPPIIYVTGSDDARVAVAALKAGAVDYVWKDFEGHYRELVGEAISSALAKGRLQREKDDAQRLVIEARDRAELLLREVNHRVANSLALVAAMTSMQARATQHEVTKNALKETQIRISAVAAIHRRLYTSSDVRFVELDAYLNNLVAELRTAISAADHTVDLDTDTDMRVATDRAVPLGMIVTELVTNALKYAYPDQKGGPIRVSLRHLGERHLRLIVEDDGVGWSGEHVVQGTGMGSMIVSAMATQLVSVVVYDTLHPGTRATLEFEV